MVAIAYGSAWLAGGAPPWGIAAMIMGSALLLGCATWLGAINSRVRPWLALCAGLSLVLLIITGFGLPFLLPAEHATSPLFLGLPLRAAIEIYGVGLLPMLFLPLIYAWQFDANELTDAALRDLVARAHAARTHVQE